MDTQTNLIFLVSSPPSQTVYPKCIKLDFNSIDFEHEIISFTEHNKVSAKVESLCEDISVEFERADSDGYITLRKDEEVIISEGIENGKMYVPGYYKLNIKLQGRTFKLLIKVEPSSISWNGLLNIRKVLENTISGLAYNLYLKKLDNDELFQNKKIPIIQMANYIIDNKHLIINNIDKIINDPIIEIMKSYKEVNYSKKIDLKTIKWLSTKGLMKNRIPTYPDISFEKRTEVSYYTNENRWLKKTIIEINETVLKIESYIITTIIKLEQKLIQKKEELVKERDKSTSLNNNHSISENYKNSIMKKIDLLGKESSELNTNVISMKGKLQELISLRSRINHYIFGTWMIDITNYNKHVEVTKKIFRNNQYSQIYFFHKEILDFKKDNQGNTAISLPFKSTSLLFEIYVVVRVIEILQEEGFLWEKGWLADFNQDNIDINLAKETTMILKKENLYCELTYDTEIIRDILELGTSQFVSDNPAHRRPDIRLSLFDSETQELKKAMIIEVKCRKKKYLFSNKGDTDTIETMKAYHSFSYYDSLQPKGARRKAGIISGVTLVYPKQEGKNILYPDDGYNNFEFIALEPNEDKSLEEGYNDLKKSVQKNLLS